MSLKLPYATRNDIIEAAVALLDQNSPPGKLKIYVAGGTAPTAATAHNDPNSAAPNVTNLLATLTLSNPSFGAASNGVCTANTIANGSIVATGTAAYFRLEDGSGNLVISGTVSASGGGGDLIFDTVAFQSGGTVTITSFALAAPQG